MKKYNNRLETGGHGDGWSEEDKEWETEIGLTGQVYPFLIHCKSKSGFRLVENSSLKGVDSPVDLCFNVKCPLKISVFFLNVP